ncbi:hypothetical protein F5141DRAFT_1213810 [Pisolithus sp. B1]|nr:hypothetical protein F5141DRAFT_1213810 [Pisolithus sp. B1]
MDSQLEDSHGYPTDTDAGPPMDDAQEELVEGPDGNFNVVELEALSAFIQEDLTDEQWQGTQDIMDKWNGAEGPTPEVQAWNAKYGLKYMWNFVEEMWQYCGMRIISLTGWKNEEGIIQACCMDFNNDIGGGSNFNDIHTINTSWREYLGTAYENPDVAAGREVPNMAANRPRAKMGDPVKAVTNDEGNI